MEVEDGLIRAIEDRGATTWVTIGGGNKCGKSSTK